MRILAITNILPTPQRPALGTFVKDQIRSLKDIGLDVDVLFVNRADKGPAAYFSLAKQIRTRLRAFEPDVVHVMYGGVMADLTTRTVTNVPTIVTFHGSDLLGENLSGLKRKLISRYGVWASKRAARRADRVVVVSNTLRNALPNDVTESKIKIIPCGIDVEQFKPLDRENCCNLLGWRSNVFNVLFATNGDPVKRPELAEAAVHGVEGLGIINVERHELRGVPHDQVPLWINASDVLLMTSMHEASPTIVKEALACNLPIVSVDVGDVAERIDGIEGCYLAMPDPNDLASKLLLVHSGLRRIKGRDKVTALSCQKIAARISSVYTELLASRRRANHTIPVAQDTSRVSS